MDSVDNEEGRFLIAWSQDSHTHGLVKEIADMKQRAGAESCLVSKSVDETALLTARRAGKLEAFDAVRQAMERIAKT